MGDTTNFFDFTNPNLEKLNPNEKKLFDYVVKNIHEVKNMSIRTLSHRCYVSTTTMFRFVRKLGFAGYAEFLNVLRLTDLPTEYSELPPVVYRQNYVEDYLKNIEETLRVLPRDKIDQFCSFMKQFPRIYLVASGLSFRVAQYIQHLYTVLGFDIRLACEAYEIRNAIKRIGDQDILWAVSFSGQNQTVIEMIERVLIVRRPRIISITCSNNNIIQNLSDLNFYAFADEVSHNGTDITSRTAMIAIAELLAYAWMIQQDN
ncbi:MurR/RpiR family transcriptional regulator [Enterocloster asparagiformis]|uniref:MurR/RpiR family transcriptional regulator n=1 Tax=Enterocloster asparagiformis TaxID=333367 RepID=UPI002A83B8FD|nr:MurR/RpiR family transcriptional regulator [Enterocloster asparagiformis]